MRAAYFLLLAFGIPGLRASEEIVLVNGFRLAADRHEILGQTIRIHQAGGTMEIPRESVASIEAREATPAMDTPEIPPLRENPAPETVQRTPRQHLAEAAARAGLPEEFLLSVAKAESGLRPGAISPKGAIGVMQLMPGTAKELAVNPHDTGENIEGGARLLRELLLKYQAYPDQVYRALSAYNAGPGAVARYNGVPPYTETRRYVEKVLNEFHRLKTKSAVSR